MVKSRAGLDGPRAAPGRSGFPDQFEIGAAESIRSAYRPLKPRTDEQPCHLSEEDPQYICSPAQSGLLPHSIESVQLWPGFHKCCVNNQQYIVVIVIFCLVSIGCLRNWILICSDYEKREELVKSWKLKQLLLCITDHRQFVVGPGKPGLVILVIISSVTRWEPNQSILSNQTKPNQIRSNHNQIVANQIKLKLTCNIFISHTMRAQPTHTHYSPSAIFC